MHKRMGANRRRIHGEKRRALGKAVKKAVTRGASFSTVAVVAVCVIGGAVFAAVKIASWINRSPLFVVSTIRVEGAVRVDTMDAVKLSGITPGMRMTAVRPAVCEKGIEKNAWVRCAHVQRHLPNTVTIRLEEREPIVLVNSGRVRYMDKDGVLLPLFGGTYSCLPVVSGLALDAAGRCTVGSVERVRRFLDDCGDEPVARRISQIDFSKATMVRIRIEDFPAVVELSESQTRTGIRRLGQLVESARQEPAGTPKRINLCYENLAYVQW